MTPPRPVLVLCGRDLKRRELDIVLDPEGKYPSKSLLPMLGKRVLDWQLEALSRSPFVGEIFLIGLTPEEFPSTLDLSYIPGATTSTILEKISQGSHFIQERYPEYGHLFISTGDAPGISTEAINQFCAGFDQDPEVDVLLSCVPEDITSQVFPEHGRVVAKFKDQSIYQGEMAALRHSAIPRLRGEIDQLSTRRRKFNRRGKTSHLAPILRYFFRRPTLWLLILKYLTGNLTVEGAEELLSRSFQMTIKTLIIPDPGFGMDMDLPEDYQKLVDYLLRVNLAQQPAEPV